MQTMDSNSQQPDKECNEMDGVVYKETEKSQKTCCSKLKMFIMALSFAYFAKALSGSYMKSSLTQIERRFDLSSFKVGLVDGGFEIGNLLLIITVSHFGARMHRPRLIGIGCLLMAIGSFLTGVPHFFMGRYNYETSVKTMENITNGILPCLAVQNQTTIDHTSTKSTYSANSDCDRHSSSNMWVYVFLGNVLRGIGETPVVPLGISYIDDFAKAENSAFYISCLHTITLLGPMCGFLLGSLCAKLYVDIGFVNADSVTITPKDARWVGAWWLGFLVSSVVMLLSSIAFWFFPKSLPKQGEENKIKNSHELFKENSSVPSNIPAEKLSGIVKGFIPSLRKLLGTAPYFLLLCMCILHFNYFIGLITFKAKYMEQHFGQSASKANFLIGIIQLPVVSAGIFTGGLIMKKYKLSVVGAAQLSFGASLVGYVFLISQMGITCDNSNVAGLTVTYDGKPQLSYSETTLLSQCNNDCACSLKQWDPVCAYNGITYVSPCLAGCKYSSGAGKSTVYHNCTCVASAPLLSRNSSAILGQCPRKKECSVSFIVYMVITTIGAFINSVGGTPGYMVIIRCISPELKSLAVGLQNLVIRTLGGIPAPVYFGALIDTTCLKWGIKKCGGKGACRLYNIEAYRYIFIGLMSALSGTSFLFQIAAIVLLRAKYKSSQKNTAEEAHGQEETETIKMVQMMANEDNQSNKTLDHKDE
uniref:Solute carrier organic anion transporter family member n=1 Tax=Erpetoichthys calabaricus TaxID=27687 RepID=A0A8C4RIH4_ERPCA